MIIRDSMYSMISSTATECDIPEDLNLDADTIFLIELGQGVFKEPIQHVWRMMLEYAEKKGNLFFNLTLKKKHCLFLKDKLLYLMYVSF